MCSHMDDLENMLKLEHKTNLDEYEELLRLQKTNFELSQHVERLQNDKKKLTESINTLMMEQMGEMNLIHELQTHRRKTRGEQLMIQNPTFVDECNMKWRLLSDKEKVPGMFLRTMARLQDLDKL